VEESLRFQLSLSLYLYRQIVTTTIWWRWWWM